MRYLHPDIIKFWEESGYFITEVEQLLAENESNFIYFVNKLSIINYFKVVIANIKIYNNEIINGKYWIGSHNHPPFSEKEILRLIKLKHFL